MKMEETAKINWKINNNNNNNGESSVLLREGERLDWLQRQLRNRNISCLRQLRNLKPIRLLASKRSASKCMKETESVNMENAKNRPNWSLLLPNCES